MASEAFSRSQDLENAVERALFSEGQHRLRVVELVDAVQVALTTGVPKAERTALVAKCKKEECLHIQLVVQGDEALSVAMEESFASQTQAHGCSARHLGLLQRFVAWHLDGASGLANSCLTQSSVLTVCSCARVP